MANPGSTINIHGREYPYRLRRSRRARHLLLHVDPQEGIEVVVPWRVSVAAVEQFLRDKQHWVEQTIQKYTAKHPLLVQRQFVTGTMLPYLGQSLELLVIPRAGRSRIRLVNDTTLQVMIAPGHAVRPVVEKWYRQQARAYFTVVSTELAESLGVQIASISVRDMKTRWGSCTSNRLSFNWRLLLAPAGVAHYVAVHEVTHIQHPNHSPAFWHIVEELMPDAQEHRKWLRKEGYSLVL